jgi:hypothetical protein
MSDRQPIETMPVGSWAVAHRGARSIVVYREDDSHWCDATGRTVVNMDGATWSGIVTEGDTNAE